MVELGPEEWTMVASTIWRPHEHHDRLGRANFSLVSSRPLDLWSARAHKALAQQELVEMRPSLGAHFMPPACSYILPALLLCIEHKGRSTKEPSLRPLGPSGSAGCHGEHLLTRARNAAALVSRHLADGNLSGGTTTCLARCRSSPGPPNGHLLLL